MRIVCNTSLPPATKSNKKPPCPPEEKKSVPPASEKGETTERIFNVRGGRLILTFCSIGGLVDVQIKRGGEYGLSNTELGRILEELPPLLEDAVDKLQQSLIAYSSATDSNKKIAAATQQSF